MFEEATTETIDAESLGSISQPSLSESTESQVSGSNSSTQTTEDVAEWPPETVCTAVITLLDVVVSRAYNAPLTYVETASLNQAFLPLAKKYLAGSVPVEYVALGALAMIVIPRHLAKSSNESTESTHDSSSVGSEGRREVSPFASASMGTASEVESMLSRSA